MSKRFTETGKWKKKWFIKLPIHGKVLWEYLRDNCDNAGFIEIDEFIISRDIDFKFTIKEILVLMDKQLIHINGNKYWMPKFIQHQHPKGLKENNNAQKSVIEKLNIYGIEWYYEKLKFRFKINNIPAPAQGMLRGCSGAIDKEEDKYNILTYNILTNNILTNNIIINNKLNNASEEIISFMKNIMKVSVEVQEKWLEDNSSEEIIFELEKFKNYIEANGKKYKNYNAAFSNWLKSTYRNKPQKKEVFRRCE